MPDIRLTKLEFDDSRSEVAASFDLEGNDDTLGAMHAESQSFLSALVTCPYGAEGALQTDTGREAHAQLLEHLEAFVQELREILKD